MPRDWSALVEARFKELDGKLRAAPVPNLTRDSNEQTDFGTKVDAAVATVVTTADLVKLIPIPDDSIFLRATKDSLLTSETQAAELLHLVQHEITNELQSAGVAFAPSSLDSLNRLSAIQERSLRTAFKPRQQLAFCGTGQRSGRPDESKEKRYWEYHTPNSFEVYTPQTSKRARVLEETVRSVGDRHEMFESIGKTTGGD